MIEIDFEDVMRQAAPTLRVLQIEAEVKNAPTNDALWGEIARACADTRNRYEMPMINKRPAIAATRAAYKALGKEPNRYRPSAEALCRRAVKGDELYRTTALVDLVNLASIVTGYSIGGFDADKVVGGKIVLGAGREGEPYEAIGRGQLNIHCLPVFRDSVGGIGTPTSDNDRTKMTDDTRRILLTVNIYAEEMPADDTLALISRLLTQYVEAKNIEHRIHNII